MDSECFYKFSVAVWVFSVVADDVVAYVELVFSFVAEDGRAEVEVVYGDD